MKRIIKRFYVPQRIHLKENTAGFYNSGVSACIFGASGSMGKFVGATLGNIGSDVIFPVRPGDYFNERYKYLKLSGQLGTASIVPFINFDDIKQLRRLVSTSNVVINLIGCRKYKKSRKDFEYANIEIPRRLAKVAKQSGNVLRFIHFSACGADPKSESLDFQTKYYGEQEVLNEFPEATIIRPTTIVSHYDYFTRIFLTNIEYLYDFIPVFTDLKAKRQLVNHRDLCLAILNILKLEETQGKIYELGGNEIYTLLEIYEMLFNFINLEPKIIKFNKNFWEKVSRYSVNWEYFNREDIIKQDLDIITSNKYGSFNDLYIEPSKIENVLRELVRDGKKVIYEGKDESEY